MRYRQLSDWSGGKSVNYVRLNRFLLGKDIAMTELDRRTTFSDFMRYITAPDRRAFVFALSGIFLLGVVLRYLLLARGALVNEDGIYYIWRARTLMEGDLWNGISGYWSPFYSFLIGLVGLTVGDFETGGRLVSLISGILLIPLVYYLGGLLYDRVTAIIASLLVALHSSLVLLSVWVMTESLYTLLFVGMISGGWLALRDNDPKYWALTGLLLGLAYLTKPEAIAFIALFLVCAAVAAAFRRTGLRTAVVGFFLMCLVAGACMVPYVLFMRAKIGEWTISQKISTNTPTADEVDHHLRLTDGGNQTSMDRIWGDEYLPESVPLVVERPAQGDVSEGESPTFQTRMDWAYSLFRLQVDNFLPDLISTVFLPFIVIGLFSSPWTRIDAARTLFIGAFIVSTVVGYSFAVTNVRYLMPIIPLILLWTAYGAVVFGRWASSTLTNLSSGSRKLPPAVFQGATVALLAVFATTATLARFKAPPVIETPVEEQRAGLWLRSQTAAEKTILLAPQATVAYYAEATHLYLPDEDVATIIEYAKRRNARFIVFSSRRLSRNDSAFPVIPPEAADKIRLVYSDELNEKFKVKIYEVRS